MSDQYTPTTEEVQEAASVDGAIGIDPEAFNRWLASVKAEAWEQGADSAYYDPEMRGQVNYPDNPYRETGAP